MTTSTALTVRPVTAADAVAAERLARLDSTTPLRGPALLAEADGRLVAALSLDHGRVVADPFTSTEGAVALLRLHAAQTARRDSRRRTLRPRVTATWSFAR